MQKENTFFVPGQNPASVDKWRNVPAWCAGLVISVAIIALLGWCFDITSLKALLSDGVAMTVNTAHLLIISGLCLALLHSGYTRAARILLTVALLFSLVIIYEYVSGADLYVDQSLSPGYFSRAEAIHAGRTPLLMALYTILSSTAMLLSSYKRYHSSQFVGTTLIVLIYISLLGTLFRFFGFYLPIGPVGPAFHTAASLLLLASGTILLEPGEGWIKLLYRR